VTRVAVTGVTGFVGGAVAHALSADGHEVLGLGRAESPAPWSGPYARWDLAANDPPPSRLRECEAVVHAAAHVAPWGRDAPFVEATVRGTARLIDAMAPDGRLVVIGSASVYDPRVTHADARERDGPVPPDRYLNAYGRAKAAQEGVVRARRPDAVILRPRAIWGPGDRTLLPRVMARARAGVLPLPGGGRRRGSMTYVDSLVEAVRAALGQGDVAGPVNVADATPVVPAELLEELFDRLYRPIRVVAVPSRLADGAARGMELGWRVGRFGGEPPLTRYAVAALARPLTLDLTRLHEELRVRPDAPIDVGLARTIAWLRNAGGAPRP
jgi:nucleoside-diphosphate-sugar epimerase